MIQSSALPELAARFFLTSTNTKHQKMKKTLFLLALVCVASSFSYGCSKDPGTAPPPTKEEMANDPAATDKTPGT
jgi:hypothetical protein